MNIPKFINTLVDDIASDINSLIDVFRSQLKEINGNTQRKLYKEKKNILDILGSLECQLGFYYMTEKPNDEFDPEVILNGDKIIDDFLGNLINDDIVINNVVEEEKTVIDDIVNNNAVKEKNKVMTIQDLPVELQNKIFYFSAEHPCAKMIKKGYPDARHYLQQDKDAELDAGYLFYKDYSLEQLKRKPLYFNDKNNWDLEMLKRKNIYFDLVVQKYKNKKYYDIELKDKGNIINNPVLSISKRIEEREKQCKNKQYIDEMRTYLPFRYI